MLKIKRLFLIFTFLCVHFSSSAQTVVNPMLEASLCERDAFYAGNPVEYNEALLRKAEIQMQAGMYADALHSMERLRMYSIPAAKRKEIGFKKAYAAYLKGDYDLSFSYLQESDFEVPYTEPKKKSEALAMALTFLVPAGFLYAEDPAGAVEYTALNALSVAGIIYQLSSKCYVSGLLGGAMALNLTFMGAQEKVALLIQKRNSIILKESKRSALCSFFQASSEGRTERPE